MRWLHDHAADVSEELPPKVVQGVTADPDDDYITGVAYLGQAAVIVSGDRHLTDLDAIRHGGVIARVLTPRAFLEELNRECNRLPPERV